MTNNRIPIEELARSRKEKRQSSHKRKPHSNQAKRPTSPKAATFYGQYSGMERPKFVGKPQHHKIVSATNGFEMFQADRVYTDARPNKAKNLKRVGSKKQARIRYAFVI